MESTDPSNRYTLEVSFDPATGSLQAEGDLVVVADGPVEEIGFLLNGGLDIEQFEADAEADLTVEDGIMIGDFELPNAKRLTLSLADPL